MPDRSRLPVGLVVEGKSEYYAVPVFAQRLGTAHRTPAVFHGQPVELSAGGVAQRVLPSLRAQTRKGVRKVVVVLDRESRESCAPDFARSVLNALRSKLKTFTDDPSCPIRVVVPDRKFENWLLADLAGLVSHALIRRDARRSSRANVDGFDGEAELRKLMIRGRSYEKGEMTGDLAKCVRLELREVRNRSRSLR
ncbi:MAG: hypothetical protein JSU86_08535, partial [Phycisphaerales bacterium]